ncbi:MAG: serine hydrolase [Xanthomonadales bacterium]|nr:serine hydrolase [Xanthomonadales bacterium]
MKRFCFVLGLFVTQGLAAQSFDGLQEAIEGGSFGEIKAVLVSQHGEVLFEEYFRGSSAADLHQVQSVTKSVGSALVGIAHRQGRLRLDQTLGELFGGLYPMNTGAYQNKAAITVEQVLQQRHGIAWDESSIDYRNPANPVQMMVASGDWYNYVLTRPTDAAPGGKFAYSTGASTLMSRFIRQSTGMGPDEFARQELFGPLGIGPVHWEGWSEGGMGTGLTDWPNPDEDPPLGFSLWLRARDLLKIGELYLDGGMYNGRRILDQSWIEKSWTRYSHSGNSSDFTQPGWGHGYQWWIAKVSDPRDREWHVYFASGWGSQVIFVLPELGLVVVTVADNYDYNGPDVDVMLVAGILSDIDPRLDSRFNGSWYNPETDRQGFSMEVLDEFGVVVSYWYTYTDSGSGEQRWFLLQGDVVDGVGEVVIYETSGGVFLQSDPVELIVWGSGRFTPVDCNHVTLEFESDLEPVSGTVPLTRLTGNCYSPPAAD